MRILHLKILLFDIFDEIHVHENCDLCHTGRRKQKMREMKMEGGGWVSWPVAVPDGGKDTDSGRIFPACISDPGEHCKQRE